MFYFICDHSLRRAFRSANRQHKKRARVTSSKGDGAAPTHSWTVDAMATAASLAVFFSLA